MNDPFDHLLKVCAQLPSSCPVSQRSPALPELKCNTEVGPLCLRTMPCERTDAFLRAFTFASCIQVLLVGDSGVGKSSLLMRFTADAFDESSAPTIGKAYATSVTFGALKVLTCALLTAL